MPQEFLASFAVDIDEGGVNRLEQILENNRELAGKLADAFDEARNAMEGFIRPLAEDMEGILPFPPWPRISAACGIWSWLRSTWDSSSSTGTEP